MVDGLGFVGHYIVAFFVHRWQCSVFSAVNDITFWSCFVKVRACCMLILTLIVLEEKCRGKLDKSLKEEDKVASKQQG